MFINKKIPSRFVFLMLSASVLSACGGGSSSDDKTPEVTGISFSSNNTQLNSDDSAQLVITAELDDGTTKDITADVAWESDDVEIASISDGGLLITKANAGSVTITVTYNGMTVTKTITVTLDNVSPVITSAAIAAVIEGALYSYDVNASDINGDDLTYELSTFPEGMIIDAATGMISWIPTAEHVGDHDVLVTVNDDGSPSLNDEQSFSVTVSAAPVVANNSKPVITSDAVTSAVDGVAYSYSVVATDSNGDDLNYVLDSAPEGMNIDSNGNIVWVPSSTQIGTHIVRISVTDNADESLTAYQQFILDVTSSNVAPVITSVANEAATEEEAYEYSVAVADDNNISYALSTLATGMTINDQGVIMWTPTASQAGSYQVEVTATDDGTPSLSTKQTFTLVVADSNVAPVFASEPVTTVKEKDAYVYDVNVTDNNGVLFTLNTSATGMSINAQTGEISWTPGATQAGSYDVEVTATDNGDPIMSAMQTFTVVVEESNVVPVFSSAPILDVTEEAAYAYTAVADDANEGDVVTYSLNAEALAVGLEINDATGVIAWTPTNAQANSYDVVVTATDNGEPAMSVDQPFTVVVAESNVAPTIDSEAITVAQADVQYVYEVLASDLNTDALTYSLTAPEGFEIPVGMEISADGVVTWLPAGDALGALQQVIVTVTDDGVPAMSAEQSFSVGVADITGPIAPENFTAFAFTTSQINLNWTTTTDLGGGTLAGYKVYRDGVLLNNGVLSSGRTSYFDKTAAVGVEYTYTIQAFDDALEANYSEESAVVFTIRNFPIVEDFTNGAANWTTFDDSSRSSYWQEHNTGIYIQNNERGILGSSQDINAALNGTYHLGTYSYLNSVEWLSDYTVTAELTPIPEEQYSLLDDGHDIGLMFRFQNNDNYYRISFNSEYGYARLERKKNGSFTTLASDARGYAKEGDTINVKVVLAGDLIQVFVGDADNMEARFAVRDSAHSRGTVALYTQDRAIFDNVVVKANSLAPSIVIDKPVAYTANTGSNISVSAVALNGDAVEFTMDGSACTAATETSTGYFEAVCSLSQGDHTVTANLKQSGNVVATDSNKKVGASGEVRIAIGDSLTNGVKDTFRADNISADGKVIAEQGYVAILQDLLSASSAAPQSIYNEAIPGDKSSDLANKRMTSILERHPDASIAQVLIGTNDASTNDNGPVSSGVYFGNIQNIVNTLAVRNITPVIAQLPPAFNSDGSANDSRNDVVKGYNAVLRNDFNASGPDLYTYFLNQPSLFEDTLHFNGLGYVIVGHLWNHYLTGGTSLPSRASLPLVLEDLCMANSSSSCNKNFDQDLMELGGAMYSDVDASLSSLEAIPGMLDGGVWIKTSNSEVTNSRANFLSFNVDRNVDVYVAYSASDSHPAWLDDGSWTDTGEVLTRAGDFVKTMTLYKKSFAPGTIVLGGNQSSGGNSFASYVVIVKE